MYTPPSKHKKQTIKQILIYALMTTTVVLVVSLLVLFMLGYRFDRAAGTIEQGGLVQLASIPSGASLTINSARLSATTSAKTTLSPGEHTVMMSRNGYHSWQKTVDVLRGRILWLNYARLIPIDLPVEDVAELSAVTSSEQSPSRKWYALTTDKSLPRITLVNIDSSEPSVDALNLPDLAYTAPEDAADQSFRITAWDQTSRYLLVEHIYGNQKEWIVVDIEDVSRTKNITTLFDIEVEDIKFSPDNSRILYVLMGGDVRKIDTEASTISAPLVRNVSEFSIFDKSTIVYSSKLDGATKNRSVGYYTDGAREPRVIRSYSDDGKASLHISAGEYYSQTYVAVAYGGVVEVLSGPLPRSDSDDTLSLATVSTISVPAQIDYLSSRTGGRFFVAQHGKSYSVYDLELQKVTTTSLRGDNTPKNELRWIDGYRVVSGLDGKLRFYEFDGANQHDIMPIVSGQNPALTSNNRYIYAPTVNQDGEFHLSRVRLILP